LADFRATIKRKNMNMTDSDPAPMGVGNGSGKKSFRELIWWILFLVALAIGGVFIYNFYFATGSEAHFTPSGVIETGSMERSEIVERGADLQGRPLVIEAGAATIYVTGADTARASFRFEKVARADDEAGLQRALDGIHITEKGDEKAYRYTIGGRQSDGTSVRVHAVIPRETVLRVELANGSVFLSSLAGPVEVVDQNGSIEVRDARASVDARTQNGRIDVEMGVVSRDSKVRLETQNGAIAFGIPAEASAAIHAATRLGTVSADELPLADSRLRQTDVGQQYSGKLGSGASLVDLSTQNGDIHLHAVVLPPVVEPVPLQPTAEPAPTAPVAPALPDSADSEPQID